MKNKKIFIYIILAIIILLILGLTVYFITNKSSNANQEPHKTKQEPQNLLESVLKNKGKTLDEVNYKKFVGGEVLNENTNFIGFAFISSNKAYIFDPKKLTTEELSYKKVYDIPTNINIINIGSPYGADIPFYSDDGKKYAVDDTNTDSKIENSYTMFENAIYKLTDYSNVTEPYIIDKQKVIYDNRANQFYIKDNIIYKIDYGYYNYLEKKYIPTTFDKINGNYEGEKILHIYNDRIVKTDKGFYEIVNYSEENKTITTTMKINLLSKYYNDVYL